MDGDVVVGRVVGPGSAAPVGVSDAVGVPVAWAAPVWGGGRVPVVVGARWMWGRCPMRERVDLVAELERVKGAASAVQARATDAVACSQAVVAPRDVARSVGAQVALARRESPTLGDRFVGLARALVHEMPHTMAALTAGVCSERVAVAVVAATATLSVEDRGVVDARVGPLLGRLGVKAAGGAAARVAAELDAASGGGSDGGGGEVPSGDGAAGSGRDGVPVGVGSAQGRGGGVRGGAGPVAGGGGGSVPGGGAAGSWGGCGRGGYGVGVVVRAGGWSGAAGGGAPGDDRPGPARHR